MVSIIFSVFFLIRQLPQLISHLDPHLDHWQNFIHLPAFAGLLFALRWLFRDFIARYLDVTVAMAVLSLGAVIEILQPTFGRNGSWLDMSLDIAGVCAGYIVWRVYNKTLSKSWLLLCLPIVTVGLFQPLSGFYGQWQGERAFPNLLDFDQSTLTRFVELQGEAQLSVEQAPTSWPNNQTRVGYLTVTGSPWPGIFLHPPVADWRDFDSLNLQVFSLNPDPVTLAVRIDDVHYEKGSGDNFDREYSIAPGLNELHISLSDVRMAPPERTMDMQEIRMIFLYIPQPEHPLGLYLDNLRLTLPEH